MKHNYLSERGSVALCWVWRQTLWKVVGNDALFCSALNISCLDWLNFLWLRNSCFSDSICQPLFLSSIFSSSIIHSEVERLRQETLGKEGRIAQSQRTTVGEGGSQSSVFAAVWFWLWSSRAWGPNVAALMKRALQPRSSLSTPTPASTLHSSNHFSSPHSFFLPPLSFAYTC